MNEKEDVFFNFLSDGKIHIIISSIDCIYTVQLKENNTVIQKMFINISDILNDKHEQMFYFKTHNYSELVIKYCADKKYYNIYAKINGALKNEHNI